jgi:hypothetical protein
VKFSDITAPISDVARNYHYQKPPDLLVNMQEFIARSLRWLSDLLSSLHILTPAVSDTRLVANIMQAILLGTGILCIGLLLFVVWKRMRQLQAQSKLAKSQVAFSTQSLDSSGWKEQAERFAALHEWKEACRSLYLAVLHLLDEQKVLEFVPTRTNYEYWYALSHQKPIQKEFHKLFDRVEMVWFGKHKATNDDYKDCMNTVTDLYAQIMAIVSSNGKKDIFSTSRQ